MTLAEMRRLENTNAKIKRLEIAVDELALAKISLQDELKDCRRSYERYQNERNNAQSEVKSLQEENSNLRNQLMEQTIATAELRGYINRVVGEQEKEFAAANPVVPVAREHFVALNIQHRGEPDWVNYTNIASKRKKNWWEK